ncbi:MAG: hypothetical protein V3T14_01125 [Myxococcota bacterium]
MSFRWLPLLCLAMLACGTATGPLLHSRSDYGAFRARTGHLPEPNYLPFVAHRERLSDGTDALVLCRWPHQAFPLRYHVARPVIQDLEDEFNPRVPEDYVAAVHRAFRKWEEILGRPVRFEPVEDPGAADFRVHLKVVEHVAERVHVVGLVRNEEDRCRVVGPGADRDQVEIEFGVRDVYVFLLDSVGLLTPGQVERVLLHEIGHVLGASGQHSPLRGDLMYAAANDRRVDEFSLHDQNTFRALYRVPPGQVYLRLGEERPPPSPEARRAPPHLDRPIRDERFGVELRFPMGWQTIETPRGWVAVDGLSWDYDASIQVVALKGTLESYFEQYGQSFRRRGELVGSDRLEVDGRPVLRIVTRAGGRTEETTVVQWGPGSILLVIADCADAGFVIYQPWFRLVVLSLERMDAKPPVGAALASEAASEDEGEEQRGQE